MNVKTSLNLAYKIVNYVFDSEISQTAGAKEYKLTPGVGRSGKKIHSDWQTPSKRVFQLNLFYCNNFYTYLHQNSQPNLPTPISKASTCSPSSQLQILFPYWESRAIRFTTIRENKPGQNLKECANQGCKKKSHSFEKFGLIFFSKICK